MASSVVSDFVCHSSNVFHDLPAARTILSSPLNVEGQLFLEIFAGESALTLGALFSKVPYIRPWDLANGKEFDVLVNGRNIISLVRARRIAFVHLAVPCQSMTWARHPPVRDRCHVSGLARLSSSQELLVRGGNALATFAAWVCYEMLPIKAHFSVEKPLLSWLWATPEFLQLYSFDGVSYVHVRYSDYGTAYVKPTAVLHNSPHLHELWQPKADVSSGVMLRGLVQWQGTWVARTRLASPYPPALGVRFGSLVRKSFELLQHAELRHFAMAVAHGDCGFPFT